jgi:hypothetical protein
MLRTNRVSYREACPVCLGDMVEDELDAGWVVCVICARSFPAAEIEALQPPTPLPTRGPQLPGAA